MPSLIHTRKANEIYQFFVKLTHEQIRELLKAIAMECTKTEIPKADFHSTLLKVANCRFAKEIKISPIENALSSSHAWIKLELFLSNLCILLMNRLDQLKEENNKVELELIEGNFRINIKENRKTDEITAAEALSSINTGSAPDDIWKRNPLLSREDQRNPPSGAIVIKQPSKVVWTSLPFFNVEKEKDSQDMPKDTMDLTC